MISVGIIGGTGYTGKYLIQFCNDHPFVESMNIYANTTSGQTLHDVFPEFEGVIKNQVISSVDNLSYNHDLYFLTLPHGKSLDFVPFLLESGKKVIDLGGDYRLNDAESYKKWYGLDHSSPSLLSQKHYGLADIYSASDKMFVSNPGCYPTASLLSIIPAVGEFTNKIESINISAYSGASGAGKTLKQHLLLSELYSNVQAYNVGVHRHQPEIYQEINKLGYNDSFNFTTHLLPIATGIYATSFINLSETVSQDHVNKLYSNFYADKTFVRLKKEPPQLTSVVGSNFCDMNIVVTGKSIIVTAAIDNLIKGASGQAIQNMNQMYGWDETYGLLTKKEFQTKSVNEN